MRPSYSNYAITATIVITATVTAASIAATTAATLRCQTKYSTATRPYCQVAGKCCLSKTEGY